jgi:hypothetical protein
MDKGRNGKMEIYTLGDSTSMAEGLKGRSISCNRMELTLSSMSSMTLGVTR